VNYEEQGVVTYIDSRGNKRTYSDYCFFGRILKEYYCYDGSLRYTYHSCGTGNSCTAGVCKEEGDGVNVQPSSDVQRITLTGRAVEDIDNDRKIFERITDAFIVLLG
jgi:hypothetical protein